MGPDRGALPVPPQVLRGGVLVIGTSEELLPARNVGWIVPHGGAITVDGNERRIFADYA